MRTRTCDVLVIGSGLAGLTAALRLSALGHVILATKKDPSLSNSDWAQGGIASVVAPTDSFEDHVADTLTAGAGLCNEAVVRRIVEDGPARIRDLEAYGVRFERGAGGYDLGTEGGHSHRRVLHAGDITGHEVVKVLLERAWEQPSIEILPGSVAIDLVTTGWLGRAGPSRCVGAYFLDTGRDEVFAVRAQVTILATGGAGKVYLYTTNPDVATGDGVAMAWRAGLPVKNMECVQFHPTCLYHPDAKSFLISEAVRGEGARLLNAAGDAFMERYDPRGALAPRDIVARAIDHEMKQRGDTCVYLDISHQSRAFLEKRFPTIYAEVQRFGFDMAQEPIPVVPAAHYFCGGVEAGVDGTTALECLYACGEVACTGLHGANRLASNSLLEAMACAHNAADRIAATFSPGRSPPMGIPDWQPGDAVPSHEAVVVEHNWNEVRTCMWDYVGIVRTNRRLERALRRIRNLRREIRQYYLEYLITADVLELRNLASVAELVVRSAFIRKESRGLHFTLDYPTPDPSQPPRDTRIVDPPGETLLAAMEEPAG